MKLVHLRRLLRLTALYLKLLAAVATGSDRRSAVTAQLAIATSPLGLHCLCIVRAHVCTTRMGKGDNEATVAHFSLFLYADCQKRLPGVDIQAAVVINVRVNPSGGINRTRDSVQTL